MSTAALNLVAPKSLLRAQQPLDSSAQCGLKVRVNTESICRTLNPGPCQLATPADGGVTRQHERCRRRSGSVHVAAAGAAATVGSASLAETFSELKRKSKVALIPFIVAGDPDMATTERALLALDGEGADIIELGVPYSDPLADGAVIQAAATRSLANGTDLSAVLELLTKVRSRVKAPVVLFAYYNPIMKRGVEAFMRAAKEAGAAGLVIPDIPLEETGPIRELTTKHGLELVLLTTPTTPASRMHDIASATQGFLYLVSLTGVTGARAQVEGRVEQLLADIKESTQKPVAVGFGISTAAHAIQVAEWGSDGVIVGSAIVRALGEAPSAEEGLRAVTELIRSLRQGLDEFAGQR